MRTRLAVALGLALVLALPAPLRAVGTVTVTTEPASIDGRVTQYKIAWVSTAGGAVSGNAFSVTRGEILSVKFVPNAGGTQPSDLYDATLVDADGLDILSAAAANLSNSAPRRFDFEFGLFFSAGTAQQTLDLVIANAGSAKGGTVYVLVRH